MAAEWQVVERAYPSDYTIWLDDTPGTVPGANGIVIGLGKSREEALRSALAELQAHVVTLALQLAGGAVETPHGAH